MPENERGFRPPEISKEKKRPEKLFRAITLNLEELTLERLRSKLVPGDISEKEPDAKDDNELGVYMTTNFDVADKAYSRGGVVSYVETPAYDDGRTMVRNIILPSCGVIYEIETDGLKIREPKIAPVWRGHYNNGFEGEEWIADEVPPDSVKVKKLILSRYANDAEAFSIEINDNTDEELQAAIDSLKAEFNKRKMAAEQFKNYLISLKENERKNSFRIKKWREENLIPKK